MSGFAAVESDPTLRRIVRNSAFIAVAVALVALVIDGGRPDGALGVLAGAGLMAFSYRVIRQSVDARARRALRDSSGADGSSQALNTQGDGAEVPNQAPGAEGGRGPAGRPGIAGAAWMLTKYVTRYGVIAVAAWVILVPLHASPVWLFVGVSIPVAAIALEIRGVRSKTQHR